MTECPRVAAANGTVLDADVIVNCIAEHVKRGAFVHTEGCKGCPDFPFVEKVVVSAW